MYTFSELPEISGIYKRGILDNDIVPITIILMIIIDIVTGRFTANSGMFILF